MTTPDQTSSTTPAPTASSRATRILAIVAILATIGMVALIVWAIMRSGSRTPAPAPSFDRFEPAWTSAMEKAGVEATFPPGPVDVTQVRVSGRIAFETTLTAEEVSALLSVYRFETTVRGTNLALADVTAEFPDDDVASLKGKLISDGTRYDAEFTGPLLYADRTISTPGLQEARAEGFAIRGDRLRQVSEALVVYFNRYLKAVPGLTVQEARIVPGAVEVKGWAPQRIEHPAPE